MIDGEMYVKLHEVNNLFLWDLERYIRQARKLAMCVDDHGISEPPEEKGDMLEVLGNYIEWIHSQVVDGITAKEEV
jgi:hypothetical protein